MAAADLLDAILRHRVYLSRIENATVRHLLAPLEAALEGAVGRLAGTLTPFQRARLTSTLAEVRAALLEAYKRLGKDLPPALAEIAGVEAEFQAGLLSRALGVSFDALPLAQLEQLVTRPLGGYILRDSLARQAADVVTALRVSTSASIIQGEGMAEVARRFARAADVARASAESWTRTAILSASNQAALESYRAAGVDDIEWLATLDERTCPICGPRDGQRLGDVGGQAPPAHFRCRCTLIPLVTLPGIEAGTPTRASAEGPVQVKDYATWFKRQPAAFQQDVLGPSRYALYKRGKLPLGAFADQGEVLSLDELKTRHAGIFEEVAR